MATFKARFCLRNDLRDALVDPLTEWQVRELLAAQFNIEKRDILLMKRVEGQRGSGSRVSDNIDVANDNEEAGLTYKLVTGIIGLSF